ncbi:hypothetical protein GCM10027030_20940 [Luteococcus sediminum]
MVHGVVVEPRCSAQPVQQDEDRCRIPGTGREVPDAELPSPVPELPFDGIHGGLVAHRTLATQDRPEEVPHQSPPVGRKLARLPPAEAINPSHCSLPHVRF